MSPGTLFRSSRWYGTPLVPTTVQGLSNPFILWMARDHCKLGHPPMA